MSGEFQVWAEDLKTLQKTTQSLKRSLNKIGQQSDTTSFRSHVESKQQEGTDIVNRMAKRVNEYKRKSMTTRDGDKLLKQYNDLKTNFDKINEEINVKKRQYTPVEDGGNTGGYDSGGGYDSNKTSMDGGGLSSQTQEQQQFQVVSDQALSAVERAEERNKQVNKIAQDVVEIQEAFNDLNELVDDQQQQLDHIESNVNAAKEDVESGHEQIKKAEKHQISARKKQLYILLCILILVGIIVISSVCGSGNC